jgi:hypothetical protein
LVGSLVESPTLLSGNFFSTPLAASLVASGEGPLGFETKFVFPNLRAVSLGDSRVYG